MYSLWSKSMQANVAKEARSQIAVSKGDQKFYIPLFVNKNTDNCSGFLIVKASNSNAMTLEEWAKIDA